MKKELIDTMESWEGIEAKIYETEDGKCHVEFSSTLNNREFANYDAATSWLYRVGFIW